MNGNFPPLPCKEYRTATLLDTVFFIEEVDVVNTTS